MRFRSTRYMIFDIHFRKRSFHNKNLSQSRMSAILPDFFDKGHNGCCQPSLAAALFQNSFVIENNFYEKDPPCF